MRWLNAKIHFTHHICLWGGRGAGRRGEDKLVGEGFKSLGWDLDVLSEPSLPGGYTGWAPLNFTSKAGARSLQPFSLAPEPFVPIFVVSQLCSTEATFLCLSWICSVAFLGSYSPALPPFASFICVPDPSPADAIL